MNIAITIIETLANQLRERKEIRRWALGVSLVTTLGSIILLFFAYETETNEFITNMMTVFAIISAFLLIVSVLSFSKTPIKVENLFDIQLQNLSKEREEIQKKISEKPKDDIFNTIQLNLNQTTEYYTINKSQARNSFNASIFAMIMGLATILVGIWIFYFSETPRYEIAIITTVSGVLIEFISGAYFYVYNKSIQQINFFYEKLEKMQDTMLSIALCEGIEDEIKKIELKEKIIMNLLNRVSQ